MPVKPPNAEPPPPPMFDGECRNDLTFYVDDGLQATVGVEDQSTEQSVYMAEVTPEYATKIGRQEVVNKVRATQELRAVLSRRDVGALGATTAVLERYMNNWPRLVEEIKKLDSVEMARVMIALSRVQPDLANELLNSKDFKTASDILRATYINDKDNGGETFIVEEKNGWTHFNTALSNKDLIGVFCSLKELRGGHEAPAGRLAATAIEKSGPLEPMIDSVAMLDGDPACQLTYGLDQFYNGASPAITVGRQRVCEVNETVQPQAKKADVLPDRREGMKRLFAHPEYPEIKKLLDRFAIEYPGMDPVDAYFLDSQLMEERDNKFKDDIRGMLRSGEVSFGGFVSTGHVSMDVRNVEPKDVAATFIDMSIFCEQNGLSTEYIMPYESEDGTYNFSITCSGEDRGL